MLVTMTPQAANCRRAAMPACEDYVAGQTVTPPSVPPSIGGGMLFIRKGDIMDVGIDWSAWLAANNAVIKTSAWAAHAQSPQPPTISANGIDQALGQTVAILDASAATVGDTYYLTNTITVDDSTPNATNTYTFPTRTLARVIHVRVMP